MLDKGAAQPSVYEVYSDVICYNCGESIHHKNGCFVPKAWFSYKKGDHEVMDCPNRNLLQHISRYIGSAAIGPGFHHIELGPISESRKVVVKM